MAKKKIRETPYPIGAQVKKSVEGGYEYGVVVHTYTDKAGDFRHKVCFQTDDDDKSNASFTVLDYYPTSLEPLYEKPDDEYTGKCDPEIFKNGEPVMYMTGPRNKRIEEFKSIVQERLPEGTVIDWHTLAGRAVFRCIGDIQAAAKILCDNIRLFDEIGFGLGGYKPTVSWCVDPYPETRRECETCEHFREIMDYHEGVVHFCGYIRERYRTIKKVMVADSCNAWRKGKD